MPTINRVFCFKDLQICLRKVVKATLTRSICAGELYGQEEITYREIIVTSKLTFSLVKTDMISIRNLASVIEITNCRKASGAKTGPSCFSVSQHQSFCTASMARVATLVHHHASHAPQIFYLFSGFR